MAAIETRALEKRFGDLHAVRDLDLVVERGEVFGLLGPNGAGKSTTINILLDFVRPTAGEARVLGHDPQTEQRAVRERVGVFPEATGFYERATARDHVAFAVDMKRAEDDPTALLERVGIADAADRRVGGFSTGMRQRLGLAIALVGEPELLILDEPMSGLDPTGARLLRQIVREERDRGAAVFFSSHIMAQVEALCDRVGVMHDGELVALDTVAGLRAAVDHPTTVTVAVDGLPEDHGVGDLDGIINVTRQDGTLSVDCTDPGAKAAVVRRLDEVGATVTDLDVESPSLEAVFVDIAGDGTAATDPEAAERTDG